MSKLTPKEWTDKTIKDIEKRKNLREKGKKDAESFLFENRVKTNKSMSRIRAKCYKSK